GGRAVVVNARAQFGRGSPDLLLDIPQDVRIRLEEFLDVLPALAEPLLAQVEPGARLPDDTEVGPDIDDAADGRDALVVHDVELGLAERGRHLVLDDADPRPDADALLALLDRLDPADVEPDRRIELQRVTAGRRLRVAEHHADLHPELV